MERDNPLYTEESTQTWITPTISSVVNTNSDKYVSVGEVDLSVQFGWKSIRNKFAQKGLGRQVINGLGNIERMSSVYSWNSGDLCRR